MVPSKTTPAFPSSSLFDRSRPIIVLGEKGGIGKSLLVPILIELIRIEKDPHGRVRRGNSGLTAETKLLRSRHKKRRT